MVLVDVKFVFCYLLFASEKAYFIDKLIMLRKITCQSIERGRLCCPSSNQR